MAVVSPHNIRYVQVTATRMRKSLWANVLQATRQTHAQILPSGSGRPAMKELPVAARLYVAAVIVIGALVLAVFFPIQALPHPAWFLALLLLSSITSAFKVNLPLARSGSTMSV